MMQKLLHRPSSCCGVLPAMRSACELQCLSAETEISLRIDTLGWTFHTVTDDVLLCVMSCPVLCVLCCVSYAVLGCAG